MPYYCLFTIIDTLEHAVSIIITMILKVAIVANCTFTSFVDTGIMMHIWSIKESNKCFALGLCVAQVYFRRRAVAPVFGPVAQMLSCRGLRLYGVCGGPLCFRRWMCKDLGLYHLITKYSQNSEITSDRWSPGANRPFAISAESLVFFTCHRRFPGSSSASVHGSFATTSVGGSSQHRGWKPVNTKISQNRKSSKPEKP